MVNVRTKVKKYNNLWSKFVPKWNYDEWKGTEGGLVCFFRTDNFLFDFQIWNIIRVFSTPSVAPALFGGVLLGYVMYDTTHYYLHHGQPGTGVPKKLKVITYVEVLNVLYVVNL